MLWPLKRDSAPPAAACDDAGAGALRDALDPALFNLHFGKLIETTQEDGGIEAYIDALREKQAGFAAALAPERAGEVTLSEIEALLARVFTARRRIFPAIASIGQTSMSQAIAELLHGPRSLPERMQAFVDMVPGAAGTDRESLRAAAKLRRAAWDFSAELVHFSDCARHPLMTRWVWDQGTQSGALRELMSGRDSVKEIPFANDPRLFEAGCSWLADCLRGEGVYRDIALWADLVLAQAYTTYLRAMTDGSLGADFGRGAPPHEQLRKLLGIDAAPANGRSRVRK